MTLAGVAYTMALVLSELFVMAGLSKLRDTAATQRSFVALGVPAAGFASGAVPATEIVIALLLVAVPVVGALAALTTLAFFTTFVARQLRHGVVVPCACFGAASTEPLSFQKLIDNVAMMLAAFFALLTLGPHPPVGDLALADFGLTATIVVTYLGVRRLTARRWAASESPPSPSR